MYVYKHRNQQQDLSITVSLQSHANKTLIGNLADMTVIRYVLTHTSEMHTVASRTNQSSIQVMSEIYLLSTVKMLNCLSEHTQGAASMYGCKLMGKH